MAFNENVIRITMAVSKRDALISRCNDALAGIEDLSSDDFAFWYDLRKQLQDARETTTERVGRKKKADASVAAVAPVAAPALAVAS